MPSTKHLKKRIKSIKNTSQITKAMEVVSATKMRRSQAFALQVRPYAVASLDMLKNLLLHTSVLPELLMSRPVKSSLLLVVASDKGLAGAFNSNICRKAEGWIKEKQKASMPFSLMVVGRRIKEYFEKRGVPIVKSFVGFGDYSALKDTLPVAHALLNGFTCHDWDEADTVYTNFRTTLLQETVLKKILPVTKTGIEEMVAGVLPERGRFAKSPHHPLSTINRGPASFSRRRGEPDFPTEANYKYEYKFEPSPVEILEKLVPQLICMHVHHTILESNASEHSARMIAMKNASDNARELIEELTVEYNKSRQANITRELTEITAGKEAIEN